MRNWFNKHFIDSLLYIVFGVAVFLGALYITKNPDHYRWADKSEAIYEFVYDDMTGNGDVFVNNQLLVYSSTHSEKDIRKALSKIDATPIEFIEDQDCYVVALKESKSLSELSDYCAILDEDAAIDGTGIIYADNEIEEMLDRKSEPFKNTRPNDVFIEFMYRSRFRNENGEFTGYTDRFLLSDGKIAYISGKEGEEKEVSELYDLIKNQDPSIKYYDGNVLEESERYYREFEELALKGIKRPVATNGLAWIVDEEYIYGITYDEEYKPNVILIGRSGVDAWENRETEINEIPVWIKGIVAKLE